MLFLLNIQQVWLARIPTSIVFQFFYVCIKSISTIIIFNKCIVSKCSNNFSPPTINYTMKDERYQRIWWLVCNTNFPSFLQTLLVKTGIRKTGVSFFALLTKCWRYLLFILILRKANQYLYGGICFVLQSYIRMVSPK